MKQRCVNRIQARIARELTPAEAQEIDLRLARSAKWLRTWDPRWEKAGRSDRMQMAARHAMQAAQAEADGTLRAFDIDPQLREAGRLEFGADFDRLEQAGRIHFFDRASDYDASLQGKNDAGALVTPEGSIVIFRDRTGPRDMGRVLLHEAGAHVGMPAMLGRDGYANVIRAVERLEAQGDEAAMAAARQIPADTPEAHRGHELLAYLVETGSEAPPVKRAIAAVKAWAIRAFPKLAGKLADAETLRSLAAMAVRHAARREGRYAIGEMLFVRTGTKALDVQDADARAAFEKRVLHADPGFDPARMDEAWAMHQRYRAADTKAADLFGMVPGEDGPQARAGAELRRMDRMVERFRGCVL